MCGVYVNAGGVMMARRKTAICDRERPPRCQCRNNDDYIGKVIFPFICILDENPIGVAACAFAAFNVRSTQRVLTRHIRGSADGNYTTEGCFGICVGIFSGESLLRNLVRDRFYYKRDLLSPVIRQDASRSIYPDISSAAVAVVVVRVINVSWDWV